MVYTIEVYISGRLPLGIRSSNIFYMTFTGTYSLMKGTAYNYTSNIID